MYVDHKACLNKLIEGNAAISVCVSLLDGPISNAAELFI